MVREAGGRHAHHGENHLGGIPTSSATTRRAAATAAFPKLGWQTHATAVSRGGKSFVMRMHGKRKPAEADEGKTARDRVMA